MGAACPERPCIRMVSITTLRHISRLRKHTYWSTYSYILLSRVWLLGAGQRTAGARAGSESAAGQPACGPGTNATTNLSLAGGLDVTACSRDIQLINRVQQLYSWALLSSASPERLHERSFLRAPSVSGSGQVLSIVYSTFLKISIV